LIAFGVRRVKTSKAPRQPWRLRQRRQLRTYKLQILQGMTGSNPTLSETHEYWNNKPTTAGVLELQSCVFQLNDGVAIGWPLHMLPCALLIVETRRLT